MDPTLYCVGEFKLTAKNKDAYETKNEKTNKPGTMLIMSNVALVDGAKTQYMSCSVRVSVNTAMTKLVGVFGSVSAVQPVPTTTVSQTKQVQQNQNFDLTVFVLSRSPVRHGGEACQEKRRRSWCQCSPAMPKWLRKPTLLIKVKMKKNQCLFSI